jgi:hypothetical protein
LSSRKNILYQGHLHKERDLSALVQVARRLDGFNIVLMGKDHGMLSTYTDLNHNIIHIPFLSPPLHLNVTSWAHVGVVAYDTASLNTIYCAPNKIWEFSGFGVPILGSRNLGLKYTIGAFGAGELVDFSCENSVVAGLDAIERDYDSKRAACLAFYDSVCVSNIVAQLCQ